MAAPRAIAPSLLRCLQPRRIAAWPQAPLIPPRTSPAQLQQQQQQQQRRRPSSSSSASSTSALTYKSIHRRRISPLPTSDIPPPWSAPAAVSNILYETPLPSAAPPKRHVLNCLVQNEPGVLSRVSGILAARGFNIDSLVVCATEVDDLSRMTVVLSGQDAVVEQARRQLEDLVPVWAVLDYTAAPLVQRELLLAKVSILGPEYFEELMAHHREMTGAADDAAAAAPMASGDDHDVAINSPSVAAATAAAVADDSSSVSRPQTAADSGSSSHSPDAADAAAPAAAEQEAQPPKNEQVAAPRVEEDPYSRGDFHPSRLVASEALRHKHHHLEAITHLTHQFGGKVLDISSTNCIVEMLVFLLSFRRFRFEASDFLLPSPVYFVLVHVTIWYLLQHHQRKGELLEPC